MSEETENRRQLLLTLLQTNEEHMVHIESKEFQFIALYLVVVSFIISAALSAFFDGNLNRNNMSVMVLALLFIAILGGIVYWQVKRWNHIFKKRKEIFIGILTELITGDYNQEESGKLRCLIGEREEYKLDPSKKDELETVNRDIDRIIRKYTGANNMFLYEDELAFELGKEIRCTDKNYFVAHKEHKKRYIKTFVLIRGFILSIIIMAFVLMGFVLAYGFGWV